MKKGKITIIGAVLVGCSFLFINGTKAPLSDKNLMSAITSKYPEKESWEQYWMFKSLKSADSWARATGLYSPSRNPEETPSANFAQTGLALIKAYKVTGVLGDEVRQAQYAARISALADSLAIHSNVDDSDELKKFFASVGFPNSLSKTKRNLTGWGRFYPIKEGPNNVHQGGYTYFNLEANCNPIDSRNQSQIDWAYIEDLYDQAWTTRFLLEAAMVLTDSNSSKLWKDTAKGAIDSFLKKSQAANPYPFAFANLSPQVRAAMELYYKRGASTAQPARYEHSWYLEQNGVKRMYLNKTTGPCSKDYLVKNTNFLMAVAINLAGGLFGQEYTDVATILLETENEEIDRNNFGYYSYRHHITGTNLNSSVKMKKIGSHQESRNGSYVCKSATCALHLTLELISYKEIINQRKIWSDAYGERVLKILDHFSQKVNEYAQNPVVTYPTQTVAHSCSIRNMPHVPASNRYLDPKEFCRQNLDEYTRLGKSAGAPLAMSFLE
jgi:hypothetical protein